MCGTNKSTANQMGGQTDGQETKVKGKQASLKSKWCEEFLFSYPPALQYIYKWFTESSIGKWKYNKIKQTLFLQIFGLWPFSSTLQITFVSFCPTRKWSIAIVIIFFYLIIYIYVARSLLPLSLVQNKGPVTTVSLHFVQCRLFSHVPTM